jgi:hypothetical protein
MRQARGDETAGRFDGAVNASPLTGVKNPMAKLQYHVQGDVIEQRNAGRRVQTRSA